MKRLPGSLDEIAGLRVARWIRESTRNQFDRFGPDSQREQQDRFIERHGLLDTGLVWQVAQSGSTVWRSGAMGAMLDDRELTAARAVEWLRAFAEAWTGADVPEARKERLHAIYERIVVAGRRFVEVKLTTAAYNHGLAIALPDAVMARPEGFEPPTL